MTVLLLPGLACDAGLFASQIQALRAAGHQVRVGDAHTRAPTLPAMALTLLADHAGPLVLVGASMGGMLALEAWRQAPHRIRAIALLGSTARADTPALVQQRQRACELFAAGRGDEVLRASLLFAFHPRQARAAGLGPAYLAMLRRAGSAQLIAQNRALIARADLRALLPQVHCPVLVACGEADTVTSPGQAREMAAQLPQSRLEIVADAGHLLTMEQPSRVNALLLQWLAGLPPPGAQGVPARPGA